ncbi:MAG: hypothetical protein GY816_06450 [Cytophagales bacterium]|nr:hypothetical protein [Cytophagales bacterium]
MKKTLSIEEYSELVQVKLDDQETFYKKDRRAGVLFAVILLAVLFLIIPLLNNLLEYINLLTFSAFVVVLLLGGSIHSLVMDKKKYVLRKKRYGEIINSIQGYDKIKIHAIDAWVCVTLFQHHLEHHANEMMYRYYELNLFERIGDDILLMNCYGDFCLIPDNMFSVSKLSQIAWWIKEGIKESEQNDQ